MDDILRTGYEDMGYDLPDGNLIGSSSLQTSLYLRCRIFAGFMTWKPITACDSEARLMRLPSHGDWRTRIPPDVALDIAILGYMAVRRLGRKHVFRT